MTTFKQALLDANLEEFRDIPTEKEIDLEISPRFQEKGEELIRKAVKIRYRSSAVLKKVLLVAVIAGLLILTACAVPAVREAIIDFFFKDEGTHYSFTYDPEQAANAPDALETVYAPTDIPEGFDLMVEDISALGVALMWRNSDDVWINYIQSIMPDNPTLGDGGGFNAEGAKAEWITLEECRVLRIEDDEWIHYAWTSSEYEFSISCSSKSMETELQNAYYSIQIDENAVIPEA